ncbi:MAG: lipoyl synthase [Deltaproteobacteria bacterium]|nr:lipoyl synthase [Deltaproteobacteria bacterium]
MRACRHRRDVSRRSKRSLPRPRHGRGRGRRGLRGALRLRCRRGVRLVIARKHPEWIRVRAPTGPAVARTRAIVRDLRLHTVCEEAQCPNLGECWAHDTATFMLLGDTCTRNCGFCAVRHGRPLAVDADEPMRVADAVARLGLRHVVVTSVNRDDLPDGGAEHFAETARQVRARVPGCAVELLIPDFQGDSDALATVVRAPVDVLNHNTETVPRLYKRVRPGAAYERSLGLLAAAKRQRPALRTKSGLMLGLGEERDELRAVLRDLRAAGCDVLTLGQYLRPSAAELAVVRYLPPEEFVELGEEARAMGFAYVESGPLVRSSYHAWRHC